MAWTSPRTWSTSELVTAAIMNAHVRDNLNYLKSAVAGNIWLSVSGGRPATTNGCAQITTIEMATNKQTIPYAAFDKDAIEFMDWSFPMPDDYDAGTITAKFWWMHPATTTNFKCAWGLKGISYADGDAADAAFGTGQVANDEGGTTYDYYLSDATSAITIAGTPAAGDWVTLRAYRNATDGTNDTLAVDAWLLGVKVTYTRA